MNLYLILDFLVINSRWSCGLVMMGAGYPAVVMVSGFLDSGLDANWWKETERRTVNPLLASSFVLFVLNLFVYT